MRLIALLSLSAALAVAGCGKKKKDSGDRAASSKVATAPGESGLKPKAKKAEPPKSKIKDTYPATTDGLRDMMADMVRAHRRDEAAARARAEAVLLLPNAEAWFAKHFGADAARHLAKEYQIYGHGFAEFPRMITQQGEKYGRKQFVVDMISDPTNPKATGFQARAIQAMTERAPLFAFRLRGEGKSDFVLYNFVHDGTTFRYVGRMARLDGKLPKNHKELDKTLAEVAAAKKAPPSAP